MTRLRWSWRSLGGSATWVYSLLPLQGTKGGNAAPPLKTKPLELQFLPITTLSTTRLSWPDVPTPRKPRRGQINLILWWEMSGEKLYQNYMHHWEPWHSLEFQLLERLRQKIPSSKPAWAIWWDSVSKEKKITFIKGIYRWQRSHGGTLSENFQSLSAHSFGFQVSKKSGLPPWHLVVVI